MSDGSGEVTDTLDPVALEKAVRAIATGVDAGLSNEAQQAVKAYLAAAPQEKEPK